MPFLCLLLGLWAGAAQAIPGYITFPSDVDWVTRESDHFEILYRRGSDAFGERAILAAEKAYRLVRPIFPEAPEKTWILLADFQDSTNGYSLDFPYPHIVIFASPPQANEDLSSLDDWLSSVILHEYVHTLHLYPAHGLWKVARTIFGSDIVPNGLMPRAFHEGIATFLETQLTHGGRGRGASFPMMKRMAVKAGVWGKQFAPIDRMDGTEAYWPGGESAYFFGYYLYDELWRRKGAQGIHDLTLAFSRNWPYFISTPFEEVYRESYPNIWADIFKRQEEETKAEIAKIEKHPLSPLRYLTETRFNKWDLALSPDGKRLAFRNFHPKTGGTLDILDRATGKPVDSLRIYAGPTSGLCWGMLAGREAFFFLRQNRREFYSVNSLEAWDSRDHRSHDVALAPNVTLDHLHTLACSPDFSRLVVYQESAGVGRVRELKLSGDPTAGSGMVTPAREWTIPTTTYVSSLALIDNAIWISVHQGTGTLLYRWPEGAAAPTQVSSLKANVFNLAPSGQAGKILAITDTDGRNEVWELDLSHAHHQRMTKRVALLGGAHSFVPLPGNEFAVASYEHGGYDIAVTPPLPERSIPISSGPTATKPIETPKRVLVAEVEPTTQASDAAPAATPTPHLSEVKEYSPWGSLTPRAWVPSLLFVPEGAEIGAWLPGFDISEKHYYDIYGGYDTRGMAFGNIDYGYRFGRHFALSTGAYLLPSLLLAQNALLKLWGGSVGISGLFGAGSPQVKLSVVFRRYDPSLYGTNEQQVGLEADISHSFGFKQYPLDPYPRGGTTLALSHTQYFSAMGSYRNFFSTTGNIDQSISLPWLDGHVLYFSLRGGYTQGNLLYNSYFQGGGEILFYQQRGFFLDRGFPWGTFFGREMVSLSTEYRFPIVRIERGWGALPLYLKSLHAAVVCDVLTKSFGAQMSGDVATANYSLFNRYWASAGLELSSDWIMSYYLPTRVRLGGYHGINYFGNYGNAFRVTLGVEAAL